VRRVLIVVTVISATLALGAQKKQKHEQVKEEAERPASDARSFLELFGKLERDLGLAVQNRDRAGLDAMVAPEFVERDATDAEHEITRERWMDKTVESYNLDPSSIHFMSIRAFLGNAVINFVQKSKRPPVSGEKIREQFIVDVWVVNQGKWQVARRFISPVVQPR
jgi:hypothetical protein